MRTLAAAVSLLLASCSATHVRAPAADAGPSSEGDAGAPCTAADESCNGHDDDCDGRIDEEPVGDCGFPSAVGECIDGRCTLGHCVPGHASCDGLEANGCELDVSSDRTNCGDCGVTCGANELCDAGTCVRESIEQVAVGEHHLCARLASGRLVCWGDDLFGAIGGTFTGTGAFVEPTELSDLPPVIDVHVSEYSTCVVLHDGVVRCWGANAFGELGQGHTEPTSGRPIVPLPERALALTSAARELCAILESGHVACWGNRRDVGFSSHLTPVVVTSEPLELPLRRLRDGLVTTAIDASGRAWGWGRSFAGQIPGADDAQVAPARIEIEGSVGAIEQLDCHEHCLARDETGQVFGWGYVNVDGRIDPARAYCEPGWCEVATVSLPFAPADLAVVTTGSCAIGTASDPRLYCWGSTVDGSVPFPALAPAPVSIRSVPGLTNVTAIWSAWHGAESCVRLGTDALRCWGYFPFLGTVMGPFAPPGFE